MRLLTSSGILTLLCLCAATTLAAPPITTGTLLAEMDDLTALTAFPNPPFTCQQFSSYDRKSTTPTDHDGWFANADAGQFLRVEERDGRKEYVIMDAAGPGAIVRIWSANPHGILRFYLDHADTPTYEVSMADLLKGQLTELPAPLSGMRARGCNLYFPIPYAKHCKITGDEIVAGKQRVYYHINYRTYPAGTSITSFSPADLTTYADQIKAIAGSLATSPGGCLDLDAEDKDREGAEILPGESLDWTSSRGPGAITEFAVQPAEPLSADVLRQLVLVIEFDGRRTVACPLVDFFGAGPDARPYASMPMGITETGEMWSRWVMPYEKAAGLKIHNRGKRPVRLHATLSEIDHPWTERTMHFHAGWHVSRDVPTRPFIDWNYVTIDGRGVFAGAAFSITNQHKAWWGEGDEKIYVDGESFPSTFGTGTEDYFGYAWCRPDRFEHAYHNQPQCDGPKNYGRTAVNRWHVLDRIPFLSRFRFDMELWHWKELTVPEMSVTTYWYARPGARSNLAAPARDDLAVTTLPAYVVKRVEGVLEGEDLRVVEHTGKTEAQAIEACSGELHRWWRNAQPRDEMILGFPVKKAGRYHVFARFVKARDYGLFKLTINNRPAGLPIDLYNDGVVVSKERMLGTFELTAGENQLGVEILGAHGEAEKKYMFGLDYLRLKPVK